MKKKTAALFLALALVVGATIGGTIAWLTDTSDEVVNTFTTSDVDITLTETDADKDKDANKNSYQMVPGCTIEKDPKVKVTADSEDCYVFVKVTETGGNVTVGTTEYSFDNFIDYTMAEGWTQLKNGEQEVEGVYYREVTDTNGKKNIDIPVIGYKKGDETVENEVLVKPTVTKEMMEAINEDSSKQPKLTFTAYAIQLKKDNDNTFDPYEAWQEINPSDD
ncbi:MAG: SipW-dependent-type signal peptide-containing protein [Oscillospiraceae bacterium]|nr:SipW-dependent-type signal peptide-containing protein [Oscillospiraceae bacterium]